MATAVYRQAYEQRHGPVRTLRDMMAQEGYALAAAGCREPRLDDEELDYARTVITPHLDDGNHSAAMACLFGDDAAASFGYTPLGLSPWTGLALALHDARRSGHGSHAKPL